MKIKARILKMCSRSAKGGEKGDPNRNPWLAKMLQYILFRIFGVPVPRDYYYTFLSLMYLLKDFPIFDVPAEGYSRNESCALN